MLRVTVLAVGVCFRSTSWREATGTFTKTLSNHLNKVKLDRFTTHSTSKQQLLDSLFLSISLQQPKLLDQINIIFRHLWSPILDSLVNCCLSLHFFSAMVWVGAPSPHPIIPSEIASTPPAECYHMLSCIGARGWDQRLLCGKGNKSTV